MIKILKFKNIILLVTLFLFIAVTEASIGTDESTKLSGLEWAEAMNSKPSLPDEIDSSSIEDKEFMKSFKETEDGETIIHFFVPEADPLKVEEPTDV